MSLSKAIKEKASASVYGVRCDTGRLLLSMPKEDAKVLREAMGKDEMKTSVIVSALHEEGYKIGYDSVNRHRRGRCLCGS